MTGQRFAIRVAVSEAASDMASVKKGILAQSHKRLSQMHTFFVQDVSSLSVFRNTRGPDHESSRLHR